jgi:hypothetical protein
MMTIQESDDFFQDEGIQDGDPPVTAALPQEPSTLPAVNKKKQRRQVSTNGTSAVLPGAFSVPATEGDTALTAEALSSCSAGVARQRQNRKDHKQRDSTASSTTTSTTTAAASVSTTKAGLRQKEPPHRTPPPALLQPPPPPPPPPPSSTSGTTPHHQKSSTSNVLPANSHHDTTTLADPLTNYPDRMISAHLVTDLEDDHDHERDIMYQQAREDAAQKAREDMLRDVLVAEELVDEQLQKQRQCRTWTAVSLCVVVVVAIVAGLLGAQPWKEPAAATSAAPLVPVNNLCTGALALTLDEAQLAGDTRSAQPVKLDSCQSSVILGGLGLWYSVVGTGNPMRVSTCDSNATESYDTQISLFQGSCESRTCLGANDNGPDDQACGVSASLTWPSVLGETYVFCVHGKFAATSDDANKNNESLDVGDSIQGTPLSGTFIVTVDETAKNDFCETATPVTLSSPVQGMTDAATSDSQVSYCHGTESTAPGVWYRITSNDTASSQSRPLHVSLFHHQLATYHL